MLHQHRIDIPVLFVDTGVMFQETLDTRDRLASEYGLDIRTLKAELTMEQQTAKYGVLYLSVEGQQQCCHMRKVEPLLGIKGQYDCLIGSLRRSEGGARRHCPIVGVDPELNAIRLNPLANMDDPTLDAYIAEHNVIVNPRASSGVFDDRLWPLHDAWSCRASRSGRGGGVIWIRGHVMRDQSPSDVDDATSPASVGLPPDLVDRSWARDRLHDLAASRSDWEFVSHNGIEVAESVRGGGGVS